MRFLAVTTRPIESRHSGYDLRVANLCAQLPGEVHLVVAPLQPESDAHPGLRVDGVFASERRLTSLRATERHPLRRHLRTSNARFLGLTRPRALAAARAELAGIVPDHDATHVLVFGAEIAEVAEGLDVTTVLDICDSTALTARRAASSGTGARAWLRRVADRVDVARKRRTESRLARVFDVVTTISDVDARAVEGRGGAGTVRVVPNGVDDDYVRPLPGAAPERRGVVFWGNLAFGPNRDALRFFVRDVFLPRLRDQGVELCVLGAGAPSWLLDLAADEPSVVLPGYVDDLPAAVTRYPIMINPMRSGSGLKNKVLEAFGLGLVVVSTTLGVEALTDVEDDRHLALADGSEAFAAAVLALLADEPRRTRIRTAAHRLVGESYRWSAIGARWRDALGVPASTP